MAHAARPKVRLPAANCFWRDVTPRDAVQDAGHAWIVHKADGTRATAYWEGKDALAAHRFLAKRAKSFQGGAKA